MAKNIPKNRALGYQALVKKFRLQVIPHFCVSFASNQVSKKKIIKDERGEVHFYPKKAYLLKKRNVFDELLFAVKYEGINLEILRVLFHILPKKKLEKFIRDNVKKAEVRKIWYLYELLTDFKLNIEDMPKSKFILLLDPKKYFTSSSIKSKRHLVLDNLLGTKDFCPMVRKTKTLKQYEKKELEKWANKLLKKQGYSMPEAPQFQPSYSVNSKADLLDKERAAIMRHKRFILLLKEAERPFQLTKKKLISIHNKALSPEKRENDYRKHQNYLAYESDNGPIICRISPKPEDVEVLMRGLLDSLERMKASNISAVILSAAASFGFSIIHPFGDGNGRVQLFLVYFLLLHSKFKAAARIFLKNLIQFFYSPQFGEAVKNFDEGHLPFIKYKLHKDETLDVHGKTIDFYRSIDFTPMCEFLYSCLEESICF